MGYFIVFYSSCTLPYNKNVAFSLRDDVEGQEGSVAGGGHAQSVPAAVGAGNLHHHPDGEPGCDWLQLWSGCKLFYLSVNPRHEFVTAR